MKTLYYSDKSAKGFNSLQVIALLFESIQNGSLTMTLHGSFLFQYLDKTWTLKFDEKIQGTGFAEIYLQKSL